MVNPPDFVSFVLLIENVFTFFHSAFAPPIKSKRRKAMPPYCASKTYPGLLTSTLPGILNLKRQGRHTSLSLSLTN